MPNTAALVNNRRELSCTMHRMTAEPLRYPYEGDPGLAVRVDRALRHVADPEMGVGIVDLGLIYGVAVDEDAFHVRVTMTSAACPVTDLIVEDIVQELGRVDPDRAADVVVVWDPPWDSGMMSAKAKSAMGWD